MKLWPAVYYNACFRVLSFRGLDIRTGELSNECDVIEITSVVFCRRHESFKRRFERETSSTFNIEFFNIEFYVCRTMNFFEQTQLILMTRIIH